MLVTRRHADGPDKDEDGRAEDKDRGSNAVAGKQATCGWTRQGRGHGRKVPSAVIIRIWDMDEDAIAVADKQVIC